jgi:hypothetical protein
MERRVIRRLLSAAAIVMATALLLTCSNPFSLKDALETEVKVANDKFLEVISVIPVKSAENVNPGSPIAIEFDRDIDLDTVTTVQFVPAATFGADDVSFNTSTNTLYIDPKPYLAGPEDYEVTITKSVKGTDGSELQNEYIWSFKTRQYPAGSVRIDVDGNTNTVDTYVLHSSTVNLVLTRNSIDVTGVGIGQTVEAAITAADTPATYDDLKTSVTLAPGEGLKDIYVVFVDTSNNKSDPEHDTIFRDLYAPNVDVGADIVLNLTTTSVSQNATVDDVHSAIAGSGVASCSWTKYSGPVSSTVTFGTPTAEDTTITADTDGTYTLRLTCYDYAGRSAYDSVTLTRDTVAPGLPTLVGTLSPGIALPSYSWTPGDATGAGYYRWNYDNGTWSAESTATDYSPSSLTYGGHTFYVQERDAAGNWSASASHYYFYYPDFLLPAYAATGVSRTPTLRFGTSSEVSLGASWQIWARPNIKGASYVLIVTTSNYTYKVPETLAANMRYYWYYVRTLRGKIYESPVYYFTTGAS